jgi:hypothetical protein
MIPRAVATRYDKVADGGSNRPLMILFDTDSGVEHEVYNEASGRPRMSVMGMAHEVLASCIAGHVGLPVCKTFQPRTAHQPISPELRNPFQSA